MFAPDPRIYDDAQTLVGLNPTTQVGRTYNRTYNLVYTSPSGSTGAFATCTNSGNTTVFPTITLSGAMNTPIIQNSTTGQSIKLNISTSSADTIVIDPDLRSITYNGVPARNLLDSSSTWFGLPPGNTTLGIVVSSASATSSATITYRNGYV